MLEPINQDGSGEAPVVDQFGVSIDKEGMDIPQEDSVKEEKKEETKEKTPEMVALETKLDDYSKNLSGQNDIISSLKEKIAVLEAGGGTKKEDGKTTEGENVLFKEIKYSKDLTQDERDDMTDTEIKLFDSNATQQEAMNKMFQTIAEGNKSKESAKVEDLNSSANVEAKRLAEEAIKTNPDLAKDSKELADKIIVEFNEFNNIGITPEKLVERMAKALKNVNGYTPPKEQEIKGGNGNQPVKKGAGAGDDPFGINKIVEGVNKGNDGSYSL